MRRTPFGRTALTLAALAACEGSLGDGATSAGPAGADGSAGGATTTSTSSSGGTSAGGATNAGGGASSTSSTGSGGAAGAGGSVEPPPAVTVSRALGDDVVDSPQYLVVRKSPTEGVDAAEKARCEALLPALAGKPFFGNAHTCVIFNRGILGAIPDQATRRAVLRAGFEEPRVRVGADVVGDRRLAVEPMIDLVNADLASVTTYVGDLLAAAREARVPIVLALDAVDWWGGRPDLWNHFDPNRPGYDPANVDDVEWTGSDASTATRLFFRNWGSQIRVETPIPNLAGKKLRAAVHDAVGTVAPLVRGFVDGLAVDERWLWGGAIIGTELAIGVNHYVYPGANDLLGQPKACDPGLPLAAGCPSGGGNCAAFNHAMCPPSFTQSLSGGVAQVGYKAAMDLGLLAPGQPMTRAVLDAIVASYVEFFDGELTSAGLPERALYSHTGGTFGPKGPHSLEPAGVRTVIPGWSMYFEGASKPSIAAFVDATPARQVRPWSSPEWLPLDPAGGTPDDWHAAWEAALDFRNARMISLANWEGVYSNAAAIAGLGAALKSPRADACVVVPRVVLGWADFDGTVGVRMSAARPGTTTYLNASSSNGEVVGGGLATIDKVNTVLDAGQTSYFFSGAAPSDAWLQLVTDGCPRDGAVQRMISPLVRLSLHGDGQPPPLPRLYTRRDGPLATFAWDAPAGAAEVRLQVAEDAGFAALVLDEVVTGKAVYVRDGFDPKKGYAARVVVDGAPSNVVAP